MLVILNSLNSHNLPIFQILMILVSKFMVHRALSDKTYLSLGLLSPLSYRLSLISLFCLFFEWPLKTDFTVLPQSYVMDCFSYMVNWFSEYFPSEMQKRLKLFITFYTLKPILKK